jgi:Protein of unknown function (DUF3987)/Primase C terminal 2 (PriCT-2)/Bifunctional DNA primase/polymerase, N-terminal
MNTTIASVSGLRAELWDAGFRPVPVFNHDATVPSPGKQPLGDKWQIDARRTPPFCATSPAVRHALNTGILADGLRPIDLDIDDPEKARRCRALAISTLGDAPTRTRQGSPRSLMLYRAADGEPIKRTLTGSSHTKTHGCKVEVLGCGQQFVAFGRHPSGADLAWFPEAPGHELREALPAVTEDQIQAFLEACAPIMEAPMPVRQNGRASNGQDHASAEPQADTLRIAAALAGIPNDRAADWEDWNRVGMAVWRATGGSAAGWEAFNAWSARNEAYTPEATRARWDHYSTSPPTSIGAGSIFHMAAEAGRRARQDGPGEDDPSPDPPPHASRNRQRTDDPEEFVWTQPLDFLTDPDAEPPELLPEHIPEAINDFSFDTAERMGVDPTSVALSSIASCAAVVSDDWQVQPKRKDSTWTESARIWAAILGPPSVLKTPIIRACTKPIDKLDAAARARHADAMRIYKQQVKAAKADKSGETPEPTHPKLDRYVIEDATVEALSEVLRDDGEARQRAPARKVLCLQDEMSEFFAKLDRYRAGGKGGGDRGTYLRLYNGGPFSIDRVGRGSFRVPNWSAGFLGGIQPGPIQQAAAAMVEDGLLQRYMFAVPGPQKPGIDREPSAAAGNRYNALFPVLAGMHPPRTPDGDHIQHVVLHETAHRHREAVEARVRIMAMLPDTSPQLVAAFGKWPGLFARLCLTFHLIEIADARARGEQGPNLTVIPEETARRTAAFLFDIALPHLLRAHRLMLGTVQTGHAKWIAGYVLAERLERVTVRDVVRAYGQLSSPEARDDLTAVMASMVAVGWLEPEVPRNAAKSVHAWRVNPAVHVLFGRRAEQEQARRRQAKDDLDAHFEAMKRMKADADGE